MQTCIGNRQRRTLPSFGEMDLDWDLVCGREGRGGSVGTLRRTGKGEREHGKDIYSSATTWLSSDPVLGDFCTGYE